MRYIAKASTWFDEGTEVILIWHQDNIDFGLFVGKRNNKEDEELCPFEEFEILND